MFLLCVKVASTFREASLSQNSRNRGVGPALQRASRRSRTGFSSSAHCPQQHSVPVMIEQAPLASAERANLDNVIRLHAHPVYWND